MHKAEKHLLNIMLTPESDAKDGHLSVKEMIHFIEMKTQVPNSEEIFGHLNNCKKCNDLFMTVQKAHPILVAQAKTTTPSFFDQIKNGVVDFLRPIISPTRVGFGAGAAVAACAVLAIALFSGPDTYLTTMQMNLAMEEALQEQYTPTLGDKDAWKQRQIAQLLSGLPKGDKLRDMDIDDINVNSGIHIAMNSPTKGLAPKNDITLELRDGALYVRAANVVTTLATAHLHAILAEKRTAKFSDDAAWNMDRITRLLATLPETDRLTDSEGLTKLALGPGLESAQTILFKADGDTLHVTAFPQE